MLRARLTLGLLPLMVLFLGVCVYSYYTSQDLGISAGNLLGRSFRYIQVEQRMRDAAVRMRDALTVKNQLDTADARRRFEEARGEFRRSVNDELLHVQQPERAQLLTQLDEEFGRFSEAGEAALRAFPSEGFELYRRAQMALFPVNRALDILRERDYLQLHLAQSRIEGRTRVALRWLLLAIVSAFVLFFYLSWRLARSLLRPIKAVTDSATALGAGNLEIEVPITSRDELGQLAKSFNLMAAHLREYREATMERVVRTQRTMEATLTSTPDPVFVVAQDGSETVRNPAAEKLSLTPEFAKGWPAELSGPLGEVMKSGEHYLPLDYRQVIVVHVDREDRFFLPRILAIGDKLTAFKGAAIILQDVTKFRLLDDAKTNLVGTVSHELKTPLTSLRMAVYLLLEQNVGTVNPRQRDLLEMARDDADRLLRIMDNLLDLARLESGAASLHREVISVRELIDEIASEARVFIEAADQRLEITIEPDVEARSISVDVARLRHVFMNLLTNAAKYSPANGTVQLNAMAAPENFIRFSVRDHGPGISAENAVRIFERFYRVPDQPEKKGAGLGLAIAREIVVAHGGSIACISMLGNGSEFYFLLPA